MVHLIFAIAPFDGKYQNQEMSPKNLSASFYRWREVNILKFKPWKCGLRSRKIKTVLTPFDHNVWMCIVVFFHNFSCLATYENKWISHILNISNRKCKSRSRNTIFAMMPFDGKCQNLETSVTFFIFAKLQSVWTKVTETHRNRQIQHQNLSDLPKKQVLILRKSYPKLSEA